MTITGREQGTARAWVPSEALDAVRLSLAVIVAIWLSMRFEFSLPHWAGWTVLSVTLATRAASLRKSLWRAFSTVIGVGIAMALVANFAQDTLAFDAAVAAWLGLLTAASTVESGQRSYGFALMGFTVPIIGFANVEHPTEAFGIGVDRCSTILIGIACAYAANVLVAPGVPEVGRGLAAQLDEAADACAAWLAAAMRSRPDPGPLPSARITALSGAVDDAFTEQPSLRSGGRAVFEAPSRLGRALAAALLRARLPDRVGARSTHLLGFEGVQAERQIARVRVAARVLRGGGRLGRGRVALRPHLLLWNDRDWDGRHALNNALRAVATISIVNAFWYASGWTNGSVAATWTGLLAILFASQPDPASKVWAFTVGVLLAAVVGLVAHYLLLTMTGTFAVLAAVLLPITMVAVIGRSDKRAIYGTGYAFLVLGVTNPTNVMTYDLAASLNQLLAQVLGMGMAVVAFAALPPPASAAVRRDRARRRLVRGVRSAALDPAFLLLRPGRWLDRGFGRLALIGPDADAHRSGQALLLLGLLLLALRKADDALGRTVGRLTWAALAIRRSDPTIGRGTALRDLAGRTDVDHLQGERIAAIASLVEDIDLEGWPGVPAGTMPATRPP